MRATARQGPALLLILASVVQTGCAERASATEIVLVLDSDVRGLVQLQVELRGFADPTPIGIDLSDKRPPRTLGLAHTGGPLGPFDVIVSGYMPETAQPAIVEPRTGIFFVEGQTRALRVELRAACIGACPQGDGCMVLASGEPECRDGGALFELTPWRGHGAIDALRPVELSSGDDMDAGAKDAGEGDGTGPPMDSGRPDGGTRDAGGDAGAGGHPDGGHDAGDGDRDTGVPPVCDPGCVLAGDAAHASDIACVADTCVVACETGWADCDGNPANGCETDLSTHCGPCQTLPGRRKSLVIDGAQVSGTLTDFPLFVALDDPDLQHASDSGLDICFTAADGTTPLPFEIEQWDRDAPALGAWVRLPSLPAGADTTLQLYYGNGVEAFDRAAPSEVWDADYVAVFHMADASDARGALTGTVAGTTKATGKCGPATSFDGDGDYFEYDQDDFDNLFVDGATVEAWIRPNTTGENELGRILDKAVNETHLDGWALYLYTETGATGTFSFSIHFGGLSPKVWAGPDNLVELSTWQHVAAVFDGTGAAPTLYFNGAATTVNPIWNLGSTLPDDSATPLRIGHHATEPLRAFDGLIDEVRISRGARSADWLATQYENQNDPASFLTVGPEQAVP